MAAPADRVQLRKNENAASGGDAADDDLGFPALLDAGEDAPEVQGIFFQPPSPDAKDELVWITRDGSGNLLFKDVTDGTERTLSDLVIGSGVDVDTLLIDDVLGSSIADDVSGTLMVDQ